MRVRATKALFYGATYHRVGSVFDITEQEGPITESCMVEVPAGTETAPSEPSKHPSISLSELESERAPGPLGPRKRRKDSDA